MASTTFSYGTIIPSVWLNEVNTAVFTTIPQLAPKNSPVLVTPQLGAATATSINRNVFTQPSTPCTWTLASGKTFTVNNTITLTGTDGASLNIGTGSVSGTNTGDQNMFSTIAVSGQSSVVADTTSDTLTLVGGTGISITTDSSSDTITITNSASSVVFLTSATVSTSVANIDFLNVFSSSYDKYIIEVSGLTHNVATNRSLGFQFAVAGSVDTTSKYISAVTDGTAFAAASGTATITAAFSGDSASTSGNNCVNATITVMNANDTVAPKSFSIAGVAGATAVFRSGSYTGTTAVSGFRLTLGASNITRGTVRVYGVRNS